ncbi:MAG TPA: hypothetical protein VIU62_04475 [Chloroflexota bacterium]
MARTFEVADDTYEKLVEVALKKGKTPQQLFQDWLREQQAQPVSQPRAGNPWAPFIGTEDAESDPLATFIGAFEADTPDILVRHDHYLAEASFAASHRTYRPGNRRRSVGLT